MQPDSLKVLLIDDDEDDYQLLRGLLLGHSLSSFTLQWAPTPETGLAALKEGLHDVCLLDYRLGRQSGLDLLKEALKSGVRTPVVLLTGHGDYALDLEAMQEGAAGYLTKDQLTNAVLERSIRCAMEFARKRDELVRAKRVIHSFSQCNEAMIRIKEELELLREICRIVVESGGYRMAWVGYAEHDQERSVRPVAHHYGDDAGYLEATKITWSDAERGRDPTGVSIRTGLPRVARYGDDDPDLSGWRTEALKRGYVSAIALPLLMGANARGSLNIYSAEPKAFDAEEIELLTRVAGNLSYGIEALRRLQAQEQAEKALRESEGQLRLFIDHAPASLAMFDRKMRYLSFSRRWLTDYNLGEHALTGLSHYEVFPEIGEQWKAVHRRALSGKVVRAERDRFDRADGSVQWLRWEVRPWHEASGDIGGIVIFSEDITERMQADEALRKSQHDLSHAQAVARTGSWRMDIRRNELHWSDETYRIFGIPLGTTLTYDSLLGSVHPEDREYVDRQWAAALNGAAYDIEHRILVCGAVKWVREKAELEFDEDGSLASGFGTVQDVTELKRAEAALLESKEKYATIFDQSPIAIEHFDPQGDLVMVNQACLEMFGVLAPLEIMGFNLFEDPNVDERVKHLITEGEDVRFECEFDFEKVKDHGLYRTSRSGVRTLDTIISPLRDDSKTTGYLAQLQDITERKQAEEASRQTASRRNREMDVLAAMAVSANLTEGAVRELALELTEAASRALGVERVGLWLFEEGETRLVNIDNFIRSKGEHSSGALLLEHEFQNEFAAFRSAKYVDAHDALTDPRTAGYVEGYLKPNHITPTTTLRSEQLSSSYGRGMTHGFVL